MARSLRVLLSTVLLVTVFTFFGVAVFFQMSTASTTRPHRRQTTQTDEMPDSSDVESTNIITETIPTKVKRTTLRGQTPRAAAKLRTLRPGRDKDESILASGADSDSGVRHAWPLHALEPVRCHGARMLPTCAHATSSDYVNRKVRLSIITGRMGAFRVEVSSCTWLSHFPTSSITVFSDATPSTRRVMPHRWVAGALPQNVTEVDGDLFSPFIKKGYLRAVRSAGQGYSGAWIVAQFRFIQAIEFMARRAGILPPHYQPIFDAEPESTEYDRDADWFVVIDDDTVLQIDALAARLQQASLAPRSRLVYLSQGGWGGAGHIFSRAALTKLTSVLHECVNRWMVRQFKASDAMLVKCSALARLEKISDPGLSHCPASHMREQGLLNPQQISLHAKKDFYPPVLLATWRLSLYYYAMYCKNKEAAELATWYSGCAFGSCKHVDCSKDHDKARHLKWLELSHNETLLRLPFPASLHLP